MNKRIELHHRGKPVVLVENPIPDPPPHGAVIKLHYSGICHTDLELCTKSLSSGSGETTTLKLFPQLPLVPGHEMSGEIHSFGSKVNRDVIDFHEGDRVMLYVNVGCEDCGLCRLGESLLCERQVNFLLGIGCDGGFQQFVAIGSLSYLHHVTEGLPMDVASLLPCSGITAFSSVKAVKADICRMVRANSFADLLIIGAGGLGLWGISCARVLLPQKTRIIVVDIAEEKLEAARTAGADLALTWDRTDIEGNVEKIHTLCPKGLNGCIDFVGSGETATAAYQLMGMASTLAVVGVFGGRMNVSVPLLPLNSINVVGVRVGPPKYLRDMTDLICTGKVKPPRITHVKIEDTPRVLDDLEHGAYIGRAVISHC